METLRVVEAGIGIGNKGFQYEYDSACSTPYVSAPSSPGKFSGGGFFFSAPASPVRACRFEKGNVLSCDLQAGGNMDEEGENSVVSPGGSDFEFSARFTEFEGVAVSADELFCNGQIRPMKVALHGEAPLWPVVDVEENKAAAAPPVEESSRGRDRGLWRENSSRHRRTRSLSPLRSAPQWATETTELAHDEEEAKLKNSEAKNGGSVEATKQRRGGSKRWISLKDFLYRSKSEGRGHTRERLWAPFSLSEKHCKNSKKGEPSSKPQDSKVKAVLGSKKVDNGGANSSRRSLNNGTPVAGRRAPVSAHELHYTANRAQAEELKRKTYLPYRQGLLGCLGFSSKSYSTVNGIARSLHSLS